MPHKSVDVASGCYLCGRRARQEAFAQLIAEVHLGHDSIAHRSYNALLRYGIRSLDQLRTLSDEELSRLPSLGNVAIARIRALVPEPQQRSEDKVVRLGRASRAVNAAQGCDVCGLRAQPGTAYARLITELPLGHDKIAHRGYSVLLRYGIQSLDQLLTLSDEGLLEIPGLGKDILKRIRTVFAEPVDANPPWLSEDVTILRGGAVRAIEELWNHHYALGTATAAAMRAAADEIERCDRFNAYKAADEPTAIPSNTAVALAAAARIYRGGTPRSSA